MTLSAAMESVPVPPRKVERIWAAPLGVKRVTNPSVDDDLNDWSALRMGKSDESVEPAIKIELSTGLMATAAAES